MTDRGLFLGVQLPLALPVIIAGLRIATVTTIGLVTVTFARRPRRLRRLHPARARRQFLTEILVGTVLSVLLAVAADLALVAPGAALTPWARSREAV